MGMHSSENASAVSFEGREWVQIGTASSFGRLSDPMGPATGLTKIIRAEKRQSLRPRRKARPGDFFANSISVVLATETPRIHPQSAIIYAGRIKQSPEPALQGPNPKIPYFRCGCAADSSGE